MSRLTGRVIVVGVMLALVAACGGPGREPATSPTEPEPTPAPVLEGTGIQIPASAYAEYVAAAGVLLVAEGAADQPVAPADGTVTAYSLTDGQMMWERAVPETLFGYLAVSGVIGDVLVVAYRTVDECVEPRPASDVSCTFDAVSAFRVSDGEPVWQRLGQAVAVDPADEVVVVSLPQAPRGSELLAGLRVATGEPVWTRDDQGREWDSSSRVATVPERQLDWLQIDRWHPLPRTPHLTVTTSDFDGDCSSHAVEVLDARTGEVAWSQLLDGCLGYVDSVTVSAGVVLISAGEAYRAYDLRSDQETWRTEFNPMLAGGGVATCGEFICLGLAEPQHAIDPQTGEERWRGGQGGYLWTVPTESGPRLVNAAREIHYEGEPGFDPGICTVDPCGSLRWAPIRPVVLSAEDGGLLLELHDWHIADIFGDQVLLFRNPESYWNLTGDAELAVADLSGLAVHHLGVIPDLRLFEVIDPGYPEAQAEGCRVADAGSMVCRRTDGSLELWRYGV